LRKIAISGITSFVIGLCACDPAHNIGLTYYGPEDLVKQKRCICPEKLIFFMPDGEVLLRVKKVGCGRALLVGGVLCRTLAKTPGCLILIVLRTSSIYAFRKDML
jgi:hypothetical protein